jgi:uncharacterized DUF497 family protein
MKITYDPVKRAVTLADRGLDFEDAAEGFHDDTLDFPTFTRITASCASSRSAIFADAW